MLYFFCLFKKQNKTTTNQTNKQNEKKKNQTETILYLLVGRKAESCYGGLFII